MSLGLMVVFHLGCRGTSVYPLNLSSGEVRLVVV